MISFIINHMTCCYGYRSVSRLSSGGRWSETLSWSKSRRRRGDLQVHFMPSEVEPRCSKRTIWKSQEVPSGPYLRAICCGRPLGLLAACHWALRPIGLCQHATWLLPTQLISIVHMVWCMPRVLFAFSFILNFVLVCKIFPCFLQYLACLCGSGKGIRL